MSVMREAMYQEGLAEGRVLCTLCPHQCHVSDGYRGACGVRVNRRGRLFTLVFDRVVAHLAEPIEKKPLHHFMPGTTAYSIGTVGCPLSCPGCQNWEISQWAKDHLPRRSEWPPYDPPEDASPQLEALEREIPGDPMSPHEIVEAARLSGAASIAYTFTEPTVFYELAYDTAVLAHLAGLRNVFVTSGYISAAPLRQIATVLDAVNVDLKYSRAESYRRVSKARLEPVQDAIRGFRDAGVWVEVTTLVIPGINDTDEELRGIAGFIRSVGEEVPWHVSRFRPAHHMADRPATPLDSLHRARRIGLDAGLRHVYVGNAPEAKGEDTLCPGCGTQLITRRHLAVLSNRVRDERCPVCGALVAGVRMDGLEHPLPHRAPAR